MQRRAAHWMFCSLIWPTFHTHRHTHSLYCIQRPCSSSSLTLVSHPVGEVIQRNSFGEVWKSLCHEYMATIAAYRCEEPDTTCLQHHCKHTVHHLFQVLSALSSDPTWCEPFNWDNRCRRHCTPTHPPTNAKTPAPAHLVTALSVASAMSVRGM